MNSPLRRALPWMVVVLASLALAYAAIKLAGDAAERNYKNVLDTEVRRRALELDALTMNSNVMGSVAALGLINQAAKGVVRGVTPLDHPSIMETLQAIGESYQANGVFLVASSGIVQSSWYTIGVTLTGVDVRFRPYFQIAMKGRQNVYAAIGTTSGERALYFAAPLYGEATTRSPVIGAAVARLDVGRIDKLLGAWTSGPALLLSPQGVTYASNRADLNERMAGERTPEQLKTIRELKQFGKKFDEGTPGTLPFEIGRESVSFEDRRYAIARAPVQWNDSSGEWTLVLLGDLDDTLPAGRRAAIGGASGALAMALGTLFLVWRRRLGRANAQRESAQAELKAYAGRLESDSAAKSYLAALSDDLHRAASIAELARKFMLHVAPRVAAEYGVFYVPDDETRQLVPVGSHGASGDLEKVAMGQGLVGQCAKDLAPIVISDCRDAPMRIIWGAGEIAPRSILLLPVVQAGRLMGVILLASLREIDADKRALLDAMLPMVAMNLEIMERNAATQRQAELLQSQQARLKETETWYRGIIEQAPDGMLVVDEAGTIILANACIDAMFGHGPGALVGRKIEVLVPAAKRAGHVALREGFARSGTARAMGTLNMELRGVRADGSEFPVEVGLSNLPALGGHSRCSCASVRDVTERRRAQETVAQERERLQHVLDTSPLAVGFTAKGIIRFANPAFVETFGAGAGDASPDLYVNPGDRDTVVERLKRDGILRDHEVRMFNRHHEPRDMVMTFLPINYGGEDGILGWVMDVTERRQRENGIRPDRNEAGEIQGAGEPGPNK